MGPVVSIVRNDLLQQMLSSNGMYLATVHNGHIVKFQAVERESEAIEIVEAAALPGLPGVREAQPAGASPGGTAPPKSRKSMPKP
jgi:hypothetical protein